MAKRKPDQLDIDSSAAIKAGMSYGKYMATKMRTPMPKQEEPSEYRRVCQHCGEVFYRYDLRAQKYCSPRCKKNAENARARAGGEAEQVVKTCAICGKEFVAASYRNKYCGQLCVGVATSRRALEWKKKHKEAESNELEI